MMAPIFAAAPALARRLHPWRRPARSDPPGCRSARNGRQAAEGHDHAPVRPAGQQYVGKQLKWTPPPSVEALRGLEPLLQLAAAALADGAVLAYGRGRARPARLCTRVARRDDARALRLVREPREEARREGRQLHRRAQQPADGRLEADVDGRTPLNAERVLRARDHVLRVGLGLVVPLARVPLEGRELRRLDQRGTSWYLAGAARTAPDAKVLDVGCGIGGPYRNIAKFTRADITGITINEYQVQRANELNAKMGLADQVRSVQGDFMELPFGGDAFDAVYAIEATCHAPAATACTARSTAQLKPGAVFACYEWCLTDERTTRRARATRRSRRRSRRATACPTCATRARSTRRSRRRASSCSSRATSRSTRTRAASRGTSR